MYAIIDKEYLLCARIAFALQNDLMPSLQNKHNGVEVTLYPKLRTQTLAQSPVEEAYVKKLFRYAE